MPLDKNAAMYHPGGLMRCCIASMADQMEAATEYPKDGDKIVCQYCKGGMVYNDKAWRWDQSKE